MPRKLRTLWLVPAFFLVLLLCMTFAVSGIVFTTSASDDLHRYPGCDSYQVSVWFYRDDRQRFYPESHSMSQRDRTEFRGVCIQLTLYRATFEPLLIPTEDDPEDPRS